MSHRRNYVALKLFGLALIVGAVFAFSVRLGFLALGVAIYHTGECYGRNHIL